MNRETIPKNFGIVGSLIFLTTTIFNLILIFLSMNLNYINLTNNEILNYFRYLLYIISYTLILVAIYYLSIKYKNFKIFTFYLISIITYIFGIFFGLFIIKELNFTNEQILISLFIIQIIYIIFLATSYDIISEFTKISLFLSFVFIYLLYSIFQLMSTLAILYNENITIEYSQGSVYLFSFTLFAAGLVQLFAFIQLPKDISYFKKSEIDKC